MTTVSKLKSINLKDVYKVDIAAKSIKENKNTPATLTRVNEDYSEAESMLKGGAINSDRDKLNDLKRQSIDWVTDGTKFMLSKKPNVGEGGLPPGLYDMKSSYEQGIYLEKRPIIIDELYEMPDETIDKVLTDIRKFWNRKDCYEKYNITYKRGILLYGPPGTGKTSVVNLLAADIIAKHRGIVINLTDASTFIAFAPIIRLLEPDKPILAIIEDIDGFINENGTRQVLNMLDGNVQIDNVVYIATTNYIERLEPRVINRPSRFDRKYKVGYPNDIVRELYLTKKLKEDDLAKIDIKRWVADTKNMSLSHLKELIISCLILDVPYEEAMEALMGMNEIK